MSGTLVERIRTICLALPETEERQSHGEAAWFIKGKKQFACFADHHHDERVAVWCAAAPGIQEVLIQTEPTKVFRPPYVGPRGWIGIYLDVEQDWEEVASLLREAFRTVAPSKIAALLP